jgi:nickel-dependent lactate racemase
MQVQLAYGKTGILLRLPDDLDITCIKPYFLPGIQDPYESLLTALRHPIASSPLTAVVKPGSHVGIIFSDITRPVPNQFILPAILDELSKVSDLRITLLNACGSHRLNTDNELRMMLGAQLVDEYPIVQNNAFDTATQVRVGKTSSGNEIWINRDLVECDVKILTGFIEPHFFAGFSGGGKAVMPGMAGVQTILRNHNAGNIDHPKSTWGVTDGNPIFQEIHEAAGMIGQTFLVNVSLNKDKEITGIFAGGLESAHLAGCAFVKKTAMVPVENTFDIAITTNSGYPADLNLYQSVKGMSAAAQVINEGGTIIIAAECWDGIPEHGEYGRLLREAKNPQDILDRIHIQEMVIHDQWQAQIQALIQKKANVSVFSNYLTDEQISSALLMPCHDIEKAVEQEIKRLDHEAIICILPEGPQAVPYLA